MKRTHDSNSRFLDVIALALARQALITSFRRAVADLGQQWEKVSPIVGRMSSDCRDRYRNHIVGREVRVSGMSYVRLARGTIGLMRP